MLFAAAGAMSNLGKGGVAHSYRQKSKKQRL
jgi:hypothetical protein